MKKESEILKRSQFDKLIAAKLDDSITLPPIGPTPPLSEFSDFDFDTRENDSDEPIGWSDGDPVESSGRPIFKNSLSDTLINAEVLLPQGEDLVSAKVKCHHVNNDGQVTGKYSKNPTLNSIIYDVAFPDGAVKQYAANTITEALYSTVDDGGYSKAVLHCILEHSKNDKAIAKADKYLYTKNGNRRMRKTTIGWNMLIRWNDQSESWIPLKLMKKTTQWRLLNMPKLINQLMNLLSSGGYLIPFDSETILSLKSKLELDT